MRPAIAGSLRILAAVVVTLVSLGCAAAPLHHELTVALDPAQRRLRVTDRIVLEPGRAVALRLAARFQPERLLLDGRAMAPDQDFAPDAPAWLIKARAPADRPAVLEVHYAGELEPLDSTLDHRQVLGLSQPISAADGAFLAANTLWYPQSDRDLTTYRMKVVVPAGMRPVASGKVIAESATTSGFEAIFEAREPLPGIDLMAGPYTVAERIVRLASEREVRVRTYFHPELNALAAPYLDSAVAYLERYDASIGPYAFDSYSIVSSPLPTGFGMPGIAYLGRQVIRLPFIRTTSLGHEVLHDWWGNGVYPDYARGNWSEGLTTLLADYAFREEEGDAQARAMRIAWLRDFAAVRPEHDRPLTAFVARRHGADQVVGYNKTAFVFFMLRELIGEDHFRGGLRRFWAEHRFRVADWDDLRRAFEASAGRDLSAFFSQWVSRAGAPVIEIASARRAASADRHRLIVELRQAGALYQVNVPLRAYLDDGTSFDAVARIGDKHARITLDVPARAQSLALDPDTRVFRRLARDEIAPILREVVLDQRTAVVVAGNDAVTRETAQALARALLEHAPADWKGSAIDAAPPLLVIGLHGDVADFLQRQGLPGMPEALQARGTALAYARRGPGGHAYVVVSGRDPGALGAAARALPHLGAQSFVVFEGPRSVERGVWPIEPRRFMVTD